MAVLNQAPASQASPQQTLHTTRVQLTEEQKKRLNWLQMRMRKVKNQMDFVEIISNFLPVGIMDSKVDQLDREMRLLNQQYTSVTLAKSPFSI